MNCINPIYKLGEYLVNQISSTTTDEQFRLLLVATLNTNVNGYSISKRLNPTLCCPDCPTDECNGGTYFLGNMVNMISFVMAYINDENEKLQNRICCGNMIGSYAASTQQGVAELAVLPICCNSFSKGYVDSLLLSMETWYDEDNIHFVSDLHFLHRNIIKYNREYCDDVDEMNELIVKEWNAVVKPNDLVFDLGDLSMGSMKLAKSLLMLCYFYRSHLRLSLSLSLKVLILFLDLQNCFVLKRDPRSLYLAEISSLASMIKESDFLPTL